MNSRKGNDKTKSIFDFGNQSLMAPKPLCHMHTVYISGTIGQPEDYVDIFETIRNCSEHDIVRIHINSQGGDLMTAIQFMRVMTDCQGHIIASVEGSCMSAATMILLAAHSTEISEHSLFMFHNYSGGTIGKGGEMYDNIVYERQWSENLLRKVYEGFLEEDEIQSMLNNKDIWMNSDEVLSRLDNRVKYFEKLEAQMQKAASEEAEKPKPTRKPRRKKGDQNETA